MNQVRICVDCEAEYTLTPKKPGRVNQCRNCGLETESGQTRVMGVMVYSHKTAAEVQLLSESSAKNHLRVAARSGKKSNLGKASRSTENYGQVI